ncbi:MAG: transposase [Isosphaeraceae bacterium]
MVFHVLNRGAGRRVLFTKDDDFLAFERVVEETLRTRRMRLWAYCLMPNQWHFVVWPERDGDLPALMQHVTNTHVKRWKEHRHEIGYGHLYQGRYKCFPVETEDYFYQVVRYVEQNALRANLVERAESWRWSSLRRVCAARRHGVPHPLGVAFASPHRLAATCQPAANGSRSGGVALLRQSRSALRRSQLGHGHGRAIGAGMDDSASWKTAPDLVAVTFHHPVDWGWNGRFGLVEDRSRFGGCHLSPSW